MPIRSHVDPCLFIVFVHVKGEQIDMSLEDAVKAIEMRHGNSINSLVDRLQPRSTQAFFR